MIKDLFTIYDDVFTSYEISYDGYSFFMYRDYHNYMLCLSKLYEEIENKFDIGQEISLKSSSRSSEENANFPRPDEWRSTQVAKNLINSYASRKKISPCQVYRIIRQSEHQDKGVYITCDAKLLKSVICYMFGHHAEKILSCVNICISSIHEDDVKDEIIRCDNEIRSLKDKKFKLWGKTIDLLNENRKNMGKYNCFKSQLDLFHNA